MTMAGGSLSAAAFSVVAIAALADQRCPLALPRLLLLLLDSGGHCAVAAACWLLAAGPSGGSRLPSLPLLAQAAACGALASALDADHFLAAGSLRLEGAFNLRARPAGHSVLATVLACALVEAVRRLLVAPPPPPLLRGPPLAAAFVAVAWLSHLLRDATRRGLYFWPLWRESTPPLPYAAYLLLLVLLSLGVRAVLGVGRGAETVLPMTAPT